MSNVKVIGSSQKKCFYDTYNQLAYANLLMPWKPNKQRVGYPPVIEASSQIANFIKKKTPRPTHFCLMLHLPKTKSHLNKVCRFGCQSIVQPVSLGTV